MNGRRWQTVFGLTVALGCALFVFSQLHPTLLLRNTTTNGGDTGAHVWWPWYLEHHLLPKLRLSGWTPDYYAGMPVGHFYFPLPAVIVGILDAVLPYNVAFKLVTALGPLLLPFGAYVFARGLRARWPAPPLFAIATLPYIFYSGDQNLRISGGNLASTLAGEFSFSIALALALFFLGTFARALDTRRHFALPAVLLAATLLCHIIVAYFVGGAALILLLARRPWRNLRAATAIMIVGGALTAVWSLPLVARLGYTTDMGWTKLVQYRKYLAPGVLAWAFLLASVAIIAGLTFLRRSTLSIVAIAVVYGLAFRFAPESRLWNARLLPFYYLNLLFLAALGMAEIYAAFGNAALLVARRPVSPPRPAADDDEHSVGARAASSPPPFDAGDDAGGDDGAATADLVAPDAAADDIIPAELSQPAPLARFLATALAVLLVTLTAAAGMSYAHAHREFLPSWISWNYTGYEAKPAYPEFKQVIDTMAGLPPGRALWEPSPGGDKSVNTYGTTLALELLPYYTKGRIASMEGLYFETSATTPYHFLAVAELSVQPSNPVRDLTYGNIDRDFALGVKHMQMLGVRYFMAASDDTRDQNGAITRLGAKSRADSDPNLRFITETGQAGVNPQVARWRIYEVRAAPLVEPLKYEPVVVDHLSPHKPWLRVAAAWFQSADQLDRALAASGPGGWAHTEWRSERWRDAPRRPLPPTRVTRVHTDDDDVRFHVSRTGVPVLVKVSYFPNWKASGARGPWRVTPNLMVVVPTRHDVQLHYGRTAVDWLGIAVTVLGVAGALLLRRWRPAPLPPRRVVEASEPPQHDDEEDPVAAVA